MSRLPHEVYRREFQNDDLQFGSVPLGDLSKKVGQCRECRHELKAKDTYLTVQTFLVCRACSTRHTPAMQASNQHLGDPAAMFGDPAILACEDTLRPFGISLKEALPLEHYHRLMTEWLLKNWKRVEKEAGEAERVLGAGYARLHMKNEGTEAGMKVAGEIMLQLQVV